MNFMYIFHVSRNNVDFYRITILRCLNLLYSPDYLKLRDGKIIS